MGRRSITLNQYKSRFLAIVKNPFFWFLTVLGNSIIFLGAAAIYLFEHEVQKGALAFIDCLLWSAGLVTTIGYSDYSPMTFAGKLVVLGLMMLGTLFLWSYMGFLVSGLITPELASLEKDVEEVEKEIKGLLKEENKNINQAKKND